MSDCGHMGPCNCNPSRSAWIRNEGRRLGDRPRLGITGHLDVCPDCKGASFHKVTCPRRAP